MRIAATTLRWGAATAATGALLMSTATIAGAAEAREPAAPAAQSIRSDGQPRQASSGTTYAYRGVQGGNLCLLSRCSVGGPASRDDAGPSNTQGFNLCLLAVCDVRP
uniref:Uncharacterized protein n=1 Tax=Streptomyces sp. NBC_01401 TaxID=2903854 RepID=A0AAU3GYN7_9ACTN